MAKSYGIEMKMIRVIRVAVGYRGDERAVTELTAVIEKAMHEKWYDFFESRPECSDISSSPLSYPTELLSILIRGEFDVPPEFDEWMPPPAKTGIQIRPAVG